MQIRSIILYNTDGRVRTLTFQLGRVNIITGKSSTGKSAIIDIIEYCLGRPGFRVPEGPIRDKVAWYCVVYQVNDTQVLIAKPAPSPQRTSQSEVYLETGSAISPPPLSNLSVNSTDDAVVDYLTRLLGIAPNLNTPEEGQTRPPLEANFRHTRFYLFQKQNTVANQEILFHRQAEPGIAQAIKDTLPYFLGAVREDRLRLIHELRELQRELRLSRRRFQEVNTGDTEELVRGKSLLLEAQQVGLIGDDIAPADAAETLNALRSTIAWEPLPQLLQMSDMVARLQDELRNLRVLFQRNIGQIRAAEIFASEAEGYTSEASEQELRLQSINLIGVSESDTETCPVCSSHMAIPVASASAINRALQNMQTSLAVVQRERPRLREHIQYLIGEREGIRRRINDVEANIARLIEEDTNAQQLGNTTNRIVHVRGRISFYLENVTLTDDTSPLRSQIEQQEQQIERLQQQLDPTETEDILTSILSLLSVDMSNWAKRLELEYAGSPHRLDINKLTVVADRPGRPILMNQGMGGGQNWVGCHLIAHLALHKYFVSQSRPVPSFLVLDQPTQVYFPEDIYRSMEGNASELTDDDRIAVGRIFELLFDVCREVFPNFQVIVLDHANIDTEEFQRSLVEEPWRGDRALIPSDWL